ncbi:hypothetical protein RAC69_08690 [Microbacterium sp. LS_15]|uniref:hypothetical protein n=1 Tax=Microbacterium sp. LS_15 TaxID=3055790 RepID=UPI0035BF4795
MDELTLLRSTRDRTREPSQAARERGLTELRVRIDGETAVALFEPLGVDTTFTPVRTRRRRTLAWAGFSTVGAMSVIAALVATNVLGVGGWNSGAAPAAASILESAAVASIKASDPTVNAGQYLLVSTDGAFGLVGTLAEDADKIEANGGNIMPADDVSSLESYHDELYVPASREDDWVWIQCARTPLQTFGPRSEQLAAEHAERDTSVIRYLPGGKTLRGDDWGGYQTRTETTADYDALPRDPHQLLERIHEFNGNTGQSRDGQALEWIAVTLRSGTAPADVRAALYRAAADIPGVDITENQATLNGTTGIAIGRVETASNTDRTSSSTLRLASSSVNGWSPSMGMPASPGHRDCVDGRDHINRYIRSDGCQQLQHRMKARGHHAQSPGRSINPGSTSNLFRRHQPCLRHS